MFAASLRQGMTTRIFIPAGIRLSMGRLTIGTTRQEPQSMVGMSWLGAKPAAPPAPGTRRGRSTNRRHLALQVPQTGPHSRGRKSDEWGKGESARVNISGFL